MSDAEENGTGFVLAGLAVLAGAALMKVFSGNPSDRSRHEAEKLFQQALQAEQRFQYRDSINFAIQAIQKDGSYYPPYNHVAWLFAIHQTALQEAAQYTQKAIQLAQQAHAGPHDIAEYLDTFGEIYLAAGQTEDAIRAFEQCLQTDPQIDRTHIDYSPSFRLMIAYMNRPDLARATMLAQRALGLQPHNPVIYMFAGDAFIEAASYATALNCFKDALRLIPQWPFAIPRLIGPPQEAQPFHTYQALCKIGYLYYMMGDKKESWDAYVKATQVLPADPLALVNLSALSAEAAQQRQGAEQQALLQQMRQFLEQSVTIMASNPTLARLQLLPHLLSDPSLQAHRDLVLMLLRNHHIIAEAEYRTYQRAIPAPTGGATVYNIKIQDSTIGAFVPGSQNTLGNVQIQKSRNEERAIMSHSNQDPQQPSINITGSTTIGANITGSHITTGDIITYGSTGQSESDVAKLFAGLLQQVQQLPESPEKQVAISAVKGVQAEAERHEQADSQKVEKWLKWLFDAVPDIWQVVVSALAHPVAGLSMAIVKIAQRMHHDKHP